ncbi:MAG: trigger factor [Spirochaetes bacterium]|nr:trigger factor [Spirochaetota bacterium]
MEVKERKLENASMELAITVPAEEVTKQFDIEYKKIQKKAKIDGFRPGKAPIEVVKKKFKDSALSGAAESLIQSTYFDAVKQADIRPIDYPKVDFETIEDGTPFSYTAIVDLYPEVELADYTGIPAEEIRVKLTDKDVDTEIDAMREKHAKITPREENAVVQKGDQVEIKVKQLTDENQDSEEGFSPMQVIAGKSNNNYDFDPHVIGMACNQPKEVSLSYPKDYRVEAIAGETLPYQIVVTAINERILPAADDEFAKDLGEFETLDELRKKTRDDMERYVTERARGEAKSEILKKIVEASSYQIPLSMIEKEKTSIFGRLKQRFNINLDDQSMFAALMGMSPEDFDKKLAEEAEQSIKTSVTLGEIALVEKLEVTDDKYNEQLQKIADQYQKSREEIAELFDKNGMKQNVQSELLFDLAMDFIYEKAKIKKGSTFSMKEFMERQ